MRSDPGKRTLQWSRVVLAAVVIAIVIGPSAGHAVEIRSWADRDSGIVIEVRGVSHAEAADYEWNSQVITNQIEEWITEGTATLQEESDGFRLILSPQIEGGVDRFSSGLFTVALKGGTRLSGAVTQDTAFWELKNFGKEGAVSCGGYSSSVNRYPCCDNNSNGSFVDKTDGNCTWWAWKMVQDNWGHSLPAWGNAITWDDSARPINKTSGYVVLPIPTARSIAVSETYGGSRGHVVWVTGIGSGSVTVSEMNCDPKPILPNVRSWTYRSSTFQSYITGMWVNDFWVKATSILADPRASVAKPNFDAQFKIRNVTRSEKYRIKQLALAVHDSSGRFLWNFFRAPGNSTGAVYTAAELFAGAADGLDGGEYVNVPKSYAFFTQKGTYRIVAKVQLSDNTWIDFGYYPLTVR
jgi:surface antigen